MGEPIHPCRTEGCVRKTTKRGSQCLPCHLRDKRAAARRFCRGEGCDREIHRASRKGMCRSCSAKNRTGEFGNGPAERKPCSTGCGGSYAVSNYRKTHLCRACAARVTARSPEKRAKCSATMLARNADPEFRAARAIAVREGIHRSMQDPEKMARRIANGKRLAASSYHSTQSPEARARAAATREERRMAWCPPAYRALYREVRKATGVTAADAKAAVLDQIEVDRRKVARGVLVDQKTFIAAREASAWARERAAE